jgi:hypothetical protein
MDDKDNMPKVMTEMPPVITLHQPSPVAQTLSSIPPTPPTPSASMASSCIMSMASHTGQSNTLAPISSPMVPAPAPAPFEPSQKKPFDITSLMSPPEPTPLDSFNYAGASQAQSKDAANAAMTFRPPMSPPVSPFHKAESNASTSIPSLGPPTPSSGPIQDPILYPPQDGPPSTPSPPQRPLFEPMEVDVHERIVNDHIATRPPGLFRRVTPPNEAEYELALSFKSQMMQTMVKDPRAWLRRNREQLLADRRAAAKASKMRLPKLLPARMPATSVSLLPPIKIAKVRADRVTKPTSSSKAPSSVPRPIRTNNTPARVARGTPPPESRRIVAPNREDKKFDELPDYCPPVGSLPDKPNSLKVDWKGTPIDLANDPHAHLLHPDEISLAANLRLDCATYLTSKRRIFIRRLECARVGKEFRKTDAQQACKIDVNKASKLWTAFEKVGWLKLEWMRQWAK